MWLWCALVAAGRGVRPGLRPSCLASERWGCLGAVRPGPCCGLEPAGRFLLLGRTARHVVFVLE